jgi:hypothetical protein
MALRSTQPLTKMTTRNLPGGKKRPARRADNLPPSVKRMSENVGASTSRNPKGLHGLYKDNFYLLTLSWKKAPIWGLRLDFYYCQAVEGSLMWGALSDERMGVSFTIAAGSRQRSHSVTQGHILLSLI